jgi:tachykinin-like receptor
LLLPWKRFISISAHCENNIYNKDSLENCSKKKETKMNNNTLENLTIGEQILGNEINSEGSYTMPWWRQLIFLTAFVILITVALGGNLIVIWIVMAHKRMRTVTNYFLVNLAVADTLISLLNTLFTSTFLVYQDWWYGDLWCKIANFVSICTMSASVLTLMAIAIDR